MTDVQLLGLVLFGGAMLGLGLLLGAYCMWAYAAGLGYWDRDDVYSVDEDTPV